MNALVNKLKRGACNILYAVLIATLLTGIGWCLTLAILDAGGLLLCFVLVAFLVGVEIFNMSDILKTKKISENDLSLVTLFFNASLLAHFACAVIFIGYLDNLNVFADNFSRITDVLNEIFPSKADPKLLLKLLLAVPFVRLAAHCWYVIRLKRQKRYFLV